MSWRKWSLHRLWINLWGFNLRSSKVFEVFWYFVSVLFYFVSLAAVTCVAGCGKGCYCAEGFVRNGDGICVAPESCPSVGHCSYGEEWNDCGPADGCEASCDSNLFDMYCTAMCVPKCVCEEGNVRDSNGNCIAKESCPTSKFFIYFNFTFLIKNVFVSTAECGSNEIYTECGSGCGDLTCEVIEHEKKA